MLYDLFTLWVTLSCIFFVVIYITDIVYVVTLGGLVFGSLLFGMWTVFSLYLARRLDVRFARELAVLCLCLGGLQALCFLLPGYEMTGGIRTYAFLGCYSYAAVYMEQLLRGDSNGY